MMKSKRSAGTSTIELMISILILALVVGLVIPGMIFYGRVLKSQNFMHQAQKEMNLFTVDMNNEMLQASTVNLVNANTVTYASNESYYVPDTTKPGSFTYRKNSKVTTLRYIDGDNNPNTMNDNRIERSYTVRDAATGSVIEERLNQVLISKASPFIDPNNGSDTPVFVLKTDGGRPYIQMRLKVGDRDTPSKPEWDRYTGPGYQGFVLNYLIVPYNVSSVRTP